MKVLVDTSVWSLLLRRRTTNLSNDQSVLRAASMDLIAAGRVLLIGPVRQEVLSGIHDVKVFERLRNYLRAFPDEPLTEDDYEEATRVTSQCRAAGISGSDIDMLICAVALRRSTPIFTTDQDFSRYAGQLPIRLFQLGTN